MKTVAIILLALLSKTAIACDCNTTLIELPIEEMGLAQIETLGASRTSDIIFTGILLDAQSVEETRQNSLFDEHKEIKLELKFKLIKSYKGDKRDTIKIRTNNGTDACGFGAKKNAACLIFALKGQGGYHYTYSSECSKSIWKEEDEKRYNKYMTFLESLANMIDGEYIF